MRRGHDKNVPVPTEGEYITIRLSGCLSVAYYLGLLSPFYH